MGELIREEVRLDRSFKHDGLQTPEAQIVVWQHHNCEGSSEFGVVEMDGGFELSFGVRVWAK